MNFKASPEKPYAFSFELDPTTELEQLDSNTNGQMIELFCEYLSVRCI